ncbi:MAG: AAA family ATPase, partial [Micropepsaceae bacterium]
MTSFFVTATGTEVGKTYITCGLIDALRRRGTPVSALKPIISGFDPAQA